MLNDQERRVFSGETDSKPRTVIGTQSPQEEAGGYDKRGAPQPRSVGSAIIGAIFAVGQCNDACTKSKGPDGVGVSASLLARVALLGGRRPRGKKEGSCEQ